MLKTIGQDRLPGWGQSINGSEVSRLSVAIHFDSLQSHGGRENEVVIVVNQFCDIEELILPNYNV